MKKFCDECFCEVNCKYNEEYISEILDGIEIEYLEKYYICDECGSKFYDDLGDYNINEANKKLREHTNLITTEEIEEILLKYDIGKKPLSLVLGLGEITIIRYLNGGNPSKENSDLLKMINKSPLLMEMYLRNNKEKLSDVAYKRTLGKISQLQLVQEHSKLYQCTLYVLEKTEDVTPLALQKILYFIKGFSTQFLKTEIFTEKAQAWPHGPVYKDIYNCFSYYKGETINFKEILKGYEYDLSDEEKNLIDIIINAFGCYNGGILRNMSHLTTPWINARKGLDEQEHSAREINEKDISKFFKQICDEYDIKTEEDIFKYAQILFNQVQKQLAKI